MSVIYAAHMSEPVTYHAIDDEHRYAVHRRADGVHIGYVERDYAREWLVQDVNFNDFDRTDEGVHTYRTRSVAAEVLLEAFEAGRVPQTPTK